MEMDLWSFAKQLNLYREEKVNSLNYSKIFRQLLVAFAYSPGSNPSFIDSYLGILNITFLEMIHSLENKVEFHTVFR